MDREGKEIAVREENSTRTLSHTKTRQGGMMYSLLIQTDFALFL